MKYIFNPSIPLVSLILSLLLLNGCNLDPSLLGTAHPTQVPLPAHLGSIWPPHGSSTTLATYEASSFPTIGVGVEIFPDVINPDLVTIEGRLMDTPTLYLNGVLVPSDTLNIADGLQEVYFEDEPDTKVNIGPFLYGWQTPLAPDSYEATVVFTSTLGVKYEYSWHFDIVE